MTFTSYKKGITVSKIINTLILILSLSLPVMGNAFSFEDFFGNSVPTEPDINKINKFRESYKLIFVYTSTCSYCHKLAPNLSAFVKEYNLDIESLTANGGKIRGFSNAKYDLGRIDALYIRYFPAVMVENKNNKNETYTLASGYLSKEELKNNFIELLEYIY